MAVDAPTPILPPALPRWPAVLARGAATDMAQDRRDAALARIRAQTLWWPVPKHAARRPRALAFGPEALRRARAAYADADIAADPADPAEIDPARLEALFDPPPPLALWAALGGLGDDAAAQSALATAHGISPWTGEPLLLEAALEAQALLRAAALRARGPVRAPGLSPWKRRCLRPFLTGPDGPPRFGARAAGERLAVWGAGDAPPETLRVEDGFLRSVGLGLQHAPPLSLAIHPGRLHFDARGPNSFDRVVAEAEFTRALCARAAALRAQVTALRLTKYNLPDGAPLPDPGRRPAVLVAGQVEDDASIRLGATSVRTNRALLIAARARFPDAFLLFKPHPDVLTGRRPGMVSDAAALSDAVVESASASACLDWAGRVVSITSLIGFEALLRGKAVSCLGRPFYAGWGLTDDADPPPRARRLTLDELTAAALILYPSYIDPDVGLPCPPEIAAARLARDAARRRSLRRRAQTLWRRALSRMLSWI